jgi:hypothetical protein
MSRPRASLPADQLKDVTWIKSSHSGPTGGNCVETAVTGDGIAVRNSRFPAGPALVFTGGQWNSFLGRCQAAGEGS